MKLKRTDCIQAPLGDQQKFLLENQSDKFIDGIFIENFCSYLLKLAMTSPDSNSKTYYVFARKFECGTYNIPVYKDNDMLGKYLYQLTVTRNIPNQRLCYGI